MGEMTEQLLQVHSHPRSGTNFLCAFIARNFYPGRDLTGKEGVMGHWADPIPQEPSPWPYGALFGSHYFYAPWMERQDTIYIYRDGRDVAFSLWRTKAFLHPSWREWAFSKFLRYSLDWLYSPGWGGSFDGSIVSHWHEHLQSWAAAPNALLICFEDLVFEPAWVRDIIAEHFGFFALPEMIEIKEPVGPFSHQGRPGAWRDIFTDDDLAYFHEIVPPGWWGLYDDSV